MEYLCEKLLDETEFLSEGGIRALSKFYEKNPYTLNYDGNSYSIQYDPGDSTSDMFGGNSNWRGPVWMPVNYLFINAFKTYGFFYGDELKVEFPLHSGKSVSLSEVGNQISARLLHIFEKNPSRMKGFAMEIITGFIKKKKIKTWFYLTNIFMAIHFGDWARATKPGGLH